MKFFEDKKNWSRKTFIDPDTGVNRTEYYFKRKKAYHIQITTPLAISLAGYALIEKDLRTILVWLEKLHELQTRSFTPNQSGVLLLEDNHINDDLIKALFLAAITFYGKCFTECRGRKVKLERSNVAKDYLDTHDFIMKFRHNYGAHSGDERIERVDINLVLNPKNKYRNEKHALVRELFQPESLYLFEDDKNDFINLIKYLRQYTLEKLDKLNALVFERDINPKGMDYWYKKAKNK